MELTPEAVYESYFDDRSELDFNKLLWIVAGLIMITSSTSLWFPQIVWLVAFGAVYWQSRKIPGFTDL